MQSNYAEVILDITNTSVDRPFTYRVPEELKETIAPGMPVRVPFGNGSRPRNGYVIALKETAPQVPWEIKTILGPAEKQVSAEATLVELALWMHGHYGCMLNQALKTVLPVKNRVRKRKQKKPSDLPGSGKQDRPPEFPEGLRKSGIVLNPEQEEAVRRFREDRRQGNKGTYLLFGITGSGKTEVYAEMIREVLRERKQAILLIPEISLTFQTVRRLEAFFGDRVAIIHSKLSKGERYEQFRRAENGEADIMIGPRSAVFAPFPRLGLIIVDEEHDGAYKSETVPRYDTRDVAEKRAELSGASVVLGSATPSVPTFERASRGEVQLLTLSKRAVPGAAPARVHVADLRAELAGGNRSVFSRKLEELMRDRLGRGEQTILFMNRRGYSNFVSCRSCGNAIRCPHCDVTLTLHSDGSMVCHYCGYRIRKPERCPDCGSPYIAGFGTGTQKLEALTKKLLPEARVLRMDADAASGKNSGRDILRQFAEGGADILIGTQMVVKGHDFPKVTLVGIMAADTELYVSSYLSAERTFQLLTQAAGRAGRGKRPGDVVIQTYRPEHYAVRAAAGQDYGLFFESELSYRKAAGYPPALHLLTMQLSSKDEQLLSRTAEILSRILMEEAAPCRALVIGPVNVAVYKVHDYFRKSVYLKHSSYDILLNIKNRAEARYGDKFPGGVSVLCDFS